MPQIYDPALVGFGNLASALMLAPQQARQQRLAEEDKAIAREEHDRALAQALMFHQEDRDARNQERADRNAYQKQQFDLEQKKFTEQGNQTKAQQERQARLDAEAERKNTFEMSKDTAATGARTLQLVEAERHNKATEEGAKAKAGKGSKEGFDDHRWNRAIQIIKASTPTDIDGHRGPINFDEVQQVYDRLGPAKPLAGALKRSTGPIVPGGTFQNDAGQTMVPHKGGYVPEGYKDPPTDVPDAATFNASQDEAAANPHHPAYLDNPPVADEPDVSGEPDETEPAAVTPAVSPISLGGAARGASRLLAGALGIGGKSAPVTAAPAPATNPKGVATSNDIYMYSKQYGLTYEKARDHLASRGWTIEEDPNVVGK